MHSLKRKPKHILTGEELSTIEIQQLIELAVLLKNERLQKKNRQDLLGYQLALLFDKPSLRTRFSFTVAIRELGGDIIESIENTRKKETPEDQARVLAGYCHAIMVRSHCDVNLEKMGSASTIPIINGLTDLHHPCQILSDLLTLFETFHHLHGLTLCYIGDGNNILHSLLLLAPPMGINIHYCCPIDRMPNPVILKKSMNQIHTQTGKIKAFATPKEAVTNAQAVYTDVWASMGFEEKRADHLFNGFQVNEALMSLADPKAIFMHCLPMDRGKEVSETLPDQSCSAIFRQSENRLHMQKALLLHLLRGDQQ